MTDPKNPAKDGAKMHFDDAMSYGDYLHIDQILSAQHPLSPAHDEMLFIIQHQTSELWMKLALHEVTAAREALKGDDIRPAFKMLSRVSRIFEQLNSAWDVLRTMTPADYTTFRETLGHSSGFQSHQYRMIEFALGNRNPAMIKPHEHLPEIKAALEAELTQPSLYDVTVDRLNKAIDLPDGALIRDRSTPHAPNKALQEAWAQVYQDPSTYWDLYELAEKLVDLEDYFRRWRFNHVTTVERVIGFKRGTGGTAGVSYLKRMLEVELFPDLWQLRTGL
ncbi:MAG: tryptophan 2,3-dioxygenase [Pelagimonas sp.]|jgi:tryptophan 2,3-dioxygenase|nr:tryptophan 2,3-dioxygenase [Pelagimonas sp.]